jgi:dihydroflavonol-4-reductase
MNDLSAHPPFVVTGASGYLASWVVWELLSRGATVRGTVRNPDDTAKCQHLLDMAAELPGTLELVKADLLEPGSFDEAVAGAGVVIHTASPFVIGKVKDPYRQLINPAVEGTKNVLNAVNEAESVKKVVLTSSAVAVYGDAQDMANAGVDRFTEDHWNTTSSASHQAYSFSKTEAERAAWEMKKAQSRWTLAAINPGFILGPSKTPRADSESVKFVRGMLRGEFKMGAPKLWFGVVDVRDVAKAHVEAAIRPVEGRLILVADSKNFVEMGQILREHFGDKYPFPKGPLPNFLFYLAGPSLGFTWKFIRANSGYPVHFDNTRSRELLGIQYTPVEDTLVQHAKQLIAAHSHKQA